ncbi:tail fiber protein [Niabella sp. CC-SYL272]|uniref:phage tail protein n=1 Tax=Niabella agricola TaxID=2891571 RepID=UPI001F2B6035|nr:tail fiber protein [Niabella agricola]MCF3111455.1 tail fiber protein [Niabella agricola]
MDPFLSMIVLFGCNFAPRGWAFCQGQLLSIAQNTALFSLLGTTYGGNGQTTFALPDLRGRVPIGFGQGPGLSSYALGQQGGAETVTLLLSQMPAHTHAFMATAEAGDTSDPTGAFPANTGTLDKEYKQSPVNKVAMNAAAVETKGGSQPHTNIQPYLALNYCIALEGIFPSRN